MDEELEKRLDALMRRINDNHEVVLIELRTMPSLRADVRAMREDMASRSYVDARALETERLLERLFGRLNERLDQSERSIEERLRRLEDKEPKP